MASEGKLWVLGDSSRSTIFDKASITYPKKKKKKNDDPFSLYPSFSLLVFLGDEHNTH